MIILHIRNFINQGPQKQSWTSLKMNNSNEETIPKESETEVWSHYKLVEKTHSGSSADVYLGTCRFRNYWLYILTTKFFLLIAEEILTSKICAVKMEHAKSPPSRLEYESFAYKSLAGTSTSALS